MRISDWSSDVCSSDLQNGDLEAAGVPQNAVDFVTSLSGPMKKDEILHGLIADAMTGSLSCRLRIGHVLRTLADIAARRAPVNGSAAGVAHNNGATTIWTFNQDRTSVVEGKGGTGRVDSGGR